MRVALPVAILIALPLGVLCAQGGERAPEDDARPIWLVMVPDRHAFESAADVQVFAAVNRPATSTRDKTSQAHVQIRDSRNTTAIAQFSYDWPFPRAKSHNKGLQGPSWEGRTYELRVPAPLQPRLVPGEYLLAWYLNGARHSNVVQLRIDPNHDTRSEPLVQLLPTELPSGETPPMLGLRVRRHAPADPAFRPSDILGTTALYLRGERHGGRGYSLFGHDAPLEPGQHYTTLFSLSGFTPEVQLHGDDDIRAEVCHTMSPLLRADLGDQLGKAWDAAAVQPEKPQPTAPADGVPR